MDMCEYIYAINDTLCDSSHLLVLKLKISTPQFPSSHSRLVCLAKVTPHIASRPFLSVFKKPKAYKAVKRVIKELSTEGPEENLHKFTSFHTRREIHFT
jgi:hypothetical protein